MDIRVGDKLLMKKKHLVFVFTYYYTLFVSERQA